MILLINSKFVSYVPSCVRDHNFVKLFGIELLQGCCRPRLCSSLSPGLLVSMCVCVCVRYVQDGCMSNRLPES